MTDALKPCQSLVKSLREIAEYKHDDFSIAGDAAQRIAELEADNQQLRDKNEVLANSVKAMEMRVMKFVNAHYTIEEKLQDNALKESER